MQDFHHNRARALMESAEELYSKQDVDNAVTAMADTLNARYERPDSEEFPLVLGVMGGAVVFTGNLLPQLTFPLEFDYIHVSRYGDEDKGGEVVWKVVPRSNVSGRTVIVLDNKTQKGGAKVAQYFINNPGINSSSVNKGIHLALQPL